MIYEFLKTGEENALSPEYLKSSLGFSSVRVLQKQVERERREGKVILSSTTGGYYRAANATEIRKFIQTLTNRGIRTLSALNGAKKLLREMEDGTVE